MQHSVVINQPPADLFSFVSDLEHDPRWGRSAQVHPTSPGPVGVGTTFRQRDRILGRPLELSMEVVDDQPHHQLTVRASSRRPVLAGARTVAPVGLAPPAAPSPAAATPMGRSGWPSRCWSRWGDAACAASYPTSSPCWRSQPSGP
jgi:hypothetical protein